MIRIGNFTDEFFKLVGPRWKVAKAIAIRESGNVIGLNLYELDPNAVGDLGDAQGIFQMHQAFAIDNVVPAGNPILVTLRGVPYVSIRIMCNFIRANNEQTDEDLIGSFHDGHAGWAERGDRDGYVKAVLAILSAL